MKTFKKTILATAAVAAMSLLGTAQASTFAQSILQINNFRLLHTPGGTAFSRADFSALTGTNDAHATAERNGVFQTASSSVPITGAPPDLPQRCVGAPCPPIGENVFTPFPMPVGGNFGYADQQLTGASIILNGNPAGANAHTRADAATSNSPTQSSGNSDVGTSTTFAFSVAVPGSMTVDFDAIANLLASVSVGSAPNANANARLSWHINIIDLSNGDAMLDQTPSQLNQARSLTDGAPGSLPYNLALTHFTFTSAPLLTGRNYQLTIEHNTLANALQEEIPEPGTLAALAAGLLSMSLISRRRKQ